MKPAYTPCRLIRPRRSWHQPFSPVGTQTMLKGKRSLYYIRGR